MIRRYALYCLSHLVAFLAGTALTYYSIAQESPRGFSKTFPTPLSEALTFYKEQILNWSDLMKNAQAGRSTWEYLYLRGRMDARLIRFLNCSDNLLAGEADREWFAKLRKENKVWHINFLKRMVPEECRVMNIFVREVFAAIPHHAVAQRVRKLLDGFPPEVIMAEVEEEMLKLFVPAIAHVFLLDRDVPGFGKAGDLIWLVVGTSTFNSYFINARTAEMVALLPPRDESLLKRGIVSRVLYWPEGTKPPNK